jgi:hypothetical protein
MGSFDSVRLAPHCAQDDKVPERAALLLVSHFAEGRAAIIAVFKGLGFA